METSTRIPQMTDQRRQRLVVRGCLQRQAIDQLKTEEAKVGRGEQWVLGQESARGSEASK